MSAHHLKLDLYALAPLLDGSHARGEVLPHAGGPAQGQLRAPLQTGDGAGEHRGPARPAHEQPADVLPVGIHGDGCSGPRMDEDSKEKKIIGSLEGERAQQRKEE